MRSYGRKRSAGFGLFMLTAAGVVLAGAVVLAAAGDFFDDTEEGQKGWIQNINFTLGGRDQLWHVSTRDSYSGSHSWYCGLETTGQYDTGRAIDCSLVSHNLALGSAHATLTFWEKFNVEAGWDMCEVLVSCDGGLTYEDLRTKETHGYWSCTGSSVGWRQVSIDLSAFANKTIRIRFDFCTFDAKANGYGGWFIDDVRVAAGI